MARNHVAAAALAVLIEGLRGAGPAMAEVPLTQGCIDYVAGLYGLPVRALDGLLAAEGGRVGRVTPNTNGSQDIGPFQVNSSWVHFFTSAWRRSSDAETTLLLRDNGCANALAAAAIFRIALDQAHGNVGAAVGYYNSPHNAALAARYRRHFLDAFRAAAGRGGRFAVVPDTPKETP